MSRATPGDAEGGQGEAPSERTYRRAPSSVCILQHKLGPGIASEVGCQGLGLPATAVTYGVDGSLEAIRKCQRNATDTWAGRSEPSLSLHRRKFSAVGAEDSTQSRRIGDMTQIWRETGREESWEEERVREMKEIQRWRPPDRHKVGESLETFR